MTTILGEEALAAFRAWWDGPRLLDLVAEHGGRVLISWPIGVGKSHAIDRIIEAAVGFGSYDLVVAMFPTRRILEERAWIRTPPPGVKIVNIRPRPRPRCGDLDTTWRQFEAAGMAALGRIELCGRCPRRPGCYWPGQYGAALRGARVIYATHAHFGWAPDFGAHLAAWTGADRVLTLLDEVSFAATSFRRRVTHRDLALFADVLDAMPRGARSSRTATGVTWRGSCCGPRRPTSDPPRGGCRSSRWSGRSLSRPAAGKITASGSASSGMTCSSSVGHPWNRASGMPTAT